MSIFKEGAIGAEEISFSYTASLAETLGRANDSKLPQYEGMPRDLKGHRDNRVFNNHLANRSAQMDRRGQSGIHWGRISKRK